MRLELQLPKMIEVADYHEFIDLSDKLWAINPQLKVAEVGFYEGSYVGIVYTGSKKEPENANLIKKIQKQSKEE